MTTFTFNVPVIGIDGGTLVSSREGQLQFVLNNDADSFSYRVRSSSAALDVVSIDTADLLAINGDDKNLLSGSIGLGSEEFGKISWGSGQETFIYAISDTVSGTLTESYFLEVAGSPLPGNMSTLLGTQQFFGAITAADGAAPGSGYGHLEDIAFAGLPNVSITEDDVIELSYFFGPGEINAGLGDDLIFTNEETGHVVDGGVGFDTFQNMGFGLGNYEVLFENGALLLRGEFDTLTLRNIEEFIFPLFGGGFETFTFEEMLAFVAPDDPVFETGTALQDTLIGGNNDDQLSGLAGDDILTGREGNDTLYGGAGADTLRGGTGDDTAVGGNGRDLVYMGGGNDLFVDNGQGGIDGRDTVFANAGNDTMGGGAGNDLFNGQDGRDLLIGRLGHDRLFGGNQNDTMRGGDGNDTIAGGNGRDRAFMGNGNDVWWDNDQELFGDDYAMGGNGNDIFHVGGGMDTLTGGIGADTFEFAAAISDDIITDYEVGVDALQFDSGLWNGALDQAHLDALADTSGADLVFVFGNGDTLTMTGLSSTAGLLDDITLI